LFIIVDYYYLNLERLKNVSPVSGRALLCLKVHSTPVCSDRNSFKMKMRVGNGGMALAR
jgi:hypothetical protein